MEQNIIDGPASQTREWHDERNARRRQRYADDQGYREDKINRSRASYRGQYGAPQTPAVDRNIGSLRNTGKYRDVGRGHKVLTFTVRELAGVIGYNAQIIGRWVRDGRLPQPILECGHLRVFSLSEVRAIIAVLKDHLKDTVYYRSDHHVTKARMATVVTQARSK